METITFNAKKEFLCGGDDTIGTMPENALYSITTDFDGSIQELSYYITGYLVLSGVPKIDRHYGLRKDETVKIVVNTDVSLPEQAEYEKTVLKGYALRVQNDSMPNLLHRIMENYDFRDSDKYPYIWSIKKSYSLDNDVLSALRKEIKEHERILTIGMENGAYHICIGMSLDTKRNFYSPYLFSVRDDTKEIRYLDTETFCKMLEDAKYITEYQYGNYDGRLVTRLITDENVQVVSQRFLACLMDLPEYGVTFTRMNRYAVQAESIPKYDLYPDNKADSVLDIILQSP